MTKEQFTKFLEEWISKLQLQISIASSTDVDSENLALQNSLIQHILTLKIATSEIELTLNHTTQFYNEINQSVNYFPYWSQSDTNFIAPDFKAQIKQNIEAHSAGLRQHLKLMTFNLNFHKSLGFFKNNIVAVGANGSGKTSLSNKLKSYLQNNGVVISAQKILLIPTFNSISNISAVNSRLTAIQQADKSNKSTYSTENNGNAYGILTSIGGEFQILLENLLSEKSVLVNKYFNSIAKGELDTALPSPKIDKALSIWNSLIVHRSIQCEDGINIQLVTGDQDIYPAHLMSDGEKVILFMIAQVLLAPVNGFIVVDEPEMYLHKTILQKLWDCLEKERQDCIFIYLTHDLDFAASRTTAKKVWIRSFTHPDKWDIESIPENNLPEPLLLELLGSSKNILFCEGIKGSIDEKIYNILFPELTIIPLDSCFDVINYTKAFNRIPNLATKAFGLIDSDHHSESRLNTLKSDNIFSLLMAEVENLLLDEDFLRILASALLAAPNSVDTIKSEIIAQLNTNLELQAANYVSAKINLYFKGSHVSKGNTLIEVDQHLFNFNENIKTQEWFEHRKTELETCITEQDYKKVIRLFNNKGLKVIANKNFKISNFTDRAITLLQFNPDTHAILKQHFPMEIQN